MVSSFTTNKGFDKPANGDYVDTWNIPVNADWDIADKAFGGTLSVALTNVNVTLTKTNCQNVRILLTGNLSGNVIISFPAGVAGFFIVTDATTGAYTVTLSSAGGPGLAVNTIQGTSCFIFTDGINVFYGDDSRGSVVAGTGINVTGTGTQTISLQTPVSVSNGGTGVTSFSAGNLVVGNGTSPLQVIAPGAAGNVLTSTGTAWQSSPPSGSGGGITSISFQAAAGMGFTFTPTLVSTSGQTVVLDGTLSLAKGGTGTGTALGSVGFVKSNSSSLFTQSSINLSTDVSNTLPIANGGTGATSAASALSNLGGVGSSSPSFTGTAQFQSLTASGTIGVSGTGTFSSTGTAISTSGDIVVASNKAFKNGSCTISSDGSNTSMNFTNPTSFYGNNGFISASVNNIQNWLAQASTFTVASGITPQAYGTTTFTNVSDARVKKNVKNYDLGLSAVLQLRPITYQFNGMYGTKDDNKEIVGLVAQEVQSTALNSMVADWQYEDPATGEVADLLSVNTSQLVFALINAVKELDARVKALEAKAAG